MFRSVCKRSACAQVYLHPAVSAAVAEALRAPLCSEQQQQQQEQGRKWEQPKQWQEHQREAQGGGQATEQRRYMVWGSSTGWLVLYGAIAFGWRRCAGVELLACLVQEARQAAARLGVAGASCVVGSGVCGAGVRARLLLALSVC
mgnify:CR=1 FL=1